MFTGSLFLPDYYSVLEIPTSTKINLLAGSLRNLYTAYKRHTHTGTAVDGEPIFKLSDNTDDGTGNHIFVHGVDQKLGIGTASPDRRLHIKQSADIFTGGIALEQFANTNEWEIISSANNLWFGHNTAGKIFFGPTGKINAWWDGPTPTQLELWSDGTNGIIDTTVTPLSLRSALIEGIHIDTSGRVTKPAQPAFLAKSAVTQYNISPNTVVNVVFGDHVFVQGANFDSIYFTALATGKYQFNVNVYLANVDTNATYDIELRTTARMYRYRFDPKYSADLNRSISFSVLAGMNAGNVARVAVFQFGGAAQTDIVGSTYLDTTFSGYLVC